MFVNERDSLYGKILKLSGNLIYGFKSDPWRYLLNSKGNIGDWSDKVSNEQNSIFSCSLIFYKSMKQTDFNLLVELLSRD